MGVPKKTQKIANNHTSLSCCKHGGKQVGEHVHRLTTTVGSLPKELLVDILARVASCSSDHLFSAKLSCKDFMEAAQDDYISECISIDKFPTTNWSRTHDERSSFLSHCFKNGNPGSLFRKGMDEYFKLGKVKSGREYIKRAIKKGHSEATYVYGMLLLSRGDDRSSRHGLNLLNSMKSSKPENWSVKDSRVKVNSLINELWINIPFKLEKVETKCQTQDHVDRFRKRGWLLDDDEKLSRCETCMWYQELVYFGKKFKQIV